MKLSSSDKEPREGGVQREVKRSRYSTLRRRRRRRRRFRRVLLLLFGWSLFVVGYYALYSTLFDSHLEHMAKSSLSQMQSDYNQLLERYDTLELVLENLAQRDSVIFRTLFEAPLNRDEMERRAQSIDRYEALLELSNSEVSTYLNERIAGIEWGLQRTEDGYKQMILKVDSVGVKGRGIPAIQPVANSSLVKLTASYGLSMHPFYRTLSMHEGVDYSLAEGTRVFATADGVVEKVSQLNSTSGKTITLNHGNGYKSHYEHLGAINVRRGQRIKRGDIIALSGNSGLSLSPHLHYEITHNGSSVDPMHYFFLELGPQEYQAIQKIAQSRRQPFD